MALLAPLLLAAASARAQLTLAVSRELTLMNSPPVAVGGVVVSRELSLFDNPEADVSGVTVSRELTLMDSPPFISANVAVSRELTLMDIPPPETASATVSREWTGFLAPYAISDVGRALRVACGLQGATAGDVDRLRVATQPPEGISIADVVAIAAYAAHPPSL
jgi:hypothetical protein